MARTPNIERLTYAELAALRDEVDSLLVQRKGEERAQLKQKLQEL